MTAADPTWLDLRIPFDDAAKHHSLPLLDRMAAHIGAVSNDSSGPVTIIDIGAGTGNSALWFDHHLGQRLPDRTLRWVLVDSDPEALAMAAENLPAAQTCAAPITQLPRIADQVMANQSPGAGRLVITCSALLDVLTDEDVTAIVETLVDHRGFGLLLLSITGQWRLDPADPDDDALHRAFSTHQHRAGRLGADAPETLLEAAHRAGVTTATSASPWQLHAPADHEFIDRFLAERVDAVVEYDPNLENTAGQWLQRRRAQLDTGLTITVDHLDLYLDATAPSQDRSS